MQLFIFLKKIWESLSSIWRFFCILFCGAIIGLVFFLVHISNFFSYLSTDSKTCVNCHIMGTQYATWSHSSHKEVTNCSSCHVPQDNIIKGYAFKAMDGSRHTTIFTLRTYQDVIHIKPMGTKAVNDNCMYCHKDLFSGITYKTKYKSEYDNDGLCWHCHRETPHGTVRSIAASQYARVPMLKSMVPNWMIKLIK